MPSPSAGFTLLKTNNRRYEGGIPYTDSPGLMSGEIQANSQAAFRALMVKDASADEMFDAISRLPELKGSDRHEFDILMANAAYALSAPCDDYDALFEYMISKFDELDPSCIDMCQDTTRYILESNPLNPYLAFKLSSLNNWEGMNPAFAMNDRLLQMAVVFDDVEMVRKISESPFASVPTSDFKKNLARALAKTAYDPLSGVRILFDMTTPSMIEVEERILNQEKALGLGVSKLHSAAWEFRESVIYKAPEDVRLKNQFCEGGFDLFSLASFSKDHLLKHIPGYHKFVEHFPDMTVRCLSTAIQEKDANLIALFTNDLISAGVSGYEILYRHIKNNSAGEYLEKISDPDSLVQNYVEDLLSFSESFNPAVNISAQVLLGYVDPLLIDRYAKNNVQLKSAYAVTGDKKYLERMTETTIYNQLGIDLGL